MCCRRKRADGLAFVMIFTGVRGPRFTRIESPVAAVGDVLSRSVQVWNADELSFFMSLLVSASLCSAAPPRVSSYLSSVPLARRDPRYYTSFFSSGEFGPTPPAKNLKWPRSVSNVLELSAGKNAAWSRAVVAASPPGMRSVCASDLQPPDASTGVSCIAVDNRHLQLLAANRGQSFDLIFASHALCTCRWPLSPLRYVQASRAEPADAAGAAAAANAADAADDDADCNDGNDGDNDNAVATTCGGIAISDAGVDNFVAGLAALLRPGAGVAVFDQEGGWSFGLERRMRKAAEARGLHFYVRRGPLWTNFDYVLSATPLEDDISRDPLQLDARFVDAALLLFAPAVLSLIYASRHGAIDPALFPAINQGKAWFSKGLELRLLVPFADFLTTRDYVQRVQGLFSGGGGGGGGGAGGDEGVDNGDDDQDGVHDHGGADDSLRSPPSDMRDPPSPPPPRLGMRRSTYAPALLQA